MALSLLQSTAAVIFAIVCIALIVGWGVTARLKISLTFLSLGAWCLLYFIVSVSNGLPVFRHFLIFISASLVYLSSAPVSRAVISTVMSSILLHALATPLGLTAGSEGIKSVTNDGADEFQIISVSLLGFYYLFDRKNHTARTSVILVAINALIIESRR